MTEADLLKRIQQYKMTYGPGQCNKSIYLAGAIFGYRGYHYQLFPGFTEGHLSATIWEDGETLPIDTTPEFDSAWDTHKAAELMINDLIREEAELDETT